MKIDNNRKTLLNLLTKCADKPTVSKETERGKTNGNLDSHSVKCQVSIKKLKKKQ